VTDPLDTLIAVLLGGVLNLFALHQIRVHSRSTEVGFLVRVYGGAVLLRYAVAFPMNFLAADPSFAQAFWGDSSAYDYWGHQLALRWSGEPVTNVLLASAVSGYGWVHFVAFIYYVFGRNQLLVQIVNGLLGGLTVLVIHAIAARLFGQAPARWAALFTAFFPQMVFWSTGMYKDTAILLCIAVAMHAVLRLRERLSPGMIALFAAAVVALFTLRFYIAYFVLFAALATFVFTQRHSTVRLVVTYALLVAVLFGAINIAIRREMLEQQAAFLTLERVQAAREDQAMWGQSRFGQEYDVSTPLGAIAALPAGLAYLLFAPFPWAASGLRQLLTVPETLVWYALMPAFFRGFVFALKKQFRAVLPIVVFAISLTFAYALMQGNVGTAYRQRTQVTMFFFMFMGVGIVERRRQRTAAGTLPSGMPHS
jgi:4-amino-4-deoxy-L-arabinose transferase-like glycosyltransferase